MTIQNRHTNKSIAEDTLKVLDCGYYVTPYGKRIDISTAQEFAENNTILYTPEDSDRLIRKRISQPLDTPTDISVTDETTLNAVRRLIKEGYTDCVCLNFASAKNPGGGFLGGSQAQEESIARATGLYYCLLQAKPYYYKNQNFKSFFYTDNIIYSPGVPIIKDEEGNFLDELMTTAIITAPAVNAGVVKQREAERTDEIEPAMKRRIEKVLTIALANKHSCIVLGAWGCGVFQNEPEVIAKCFKDVIESTFKNEFQKIEFAIFSRQEKYIKPFYREFGK